MRQFLSVFARKAHPLVIFWDDLQWADSASLKLLRTLVTDPESGYFLFLGAYRDNEVDPSHPLMLMVNELHQEEVNIHQLHLKPLNQIHLSQLLQDTLHTSAKQVTPLAKLLKEKTGGNPFFVSQFLQNLYAEKLLIFNHTRRHWQWQIADIQAQAITDNVVDLMIHRIQQLPPETQQMMQWGACVGNQFDLATLAVISEQSLATAVTQLQPAIRTGFFIPSGQWNPLTSLPDAEMLAEAACQFLHDGVQQAAYQMIPSNRLEQIHLRIGRLLLANTPADELDDRLFDIVTQLNNGRALINDDAEKVQLASLNLQAAEKAKQSTAYHAAAQLFEIGLALLPDNAWQAHYDLTYALHKGTAETASLSGDFERAEFVYPIVLFEAQTNMDKVAIHFVQVIQYQLQGRYAEAIDIQRAALALLGWQVPQEPAAQQEMLAAELTAVPRHLGTREIETLVDALKMQDPEKKAMLEILQAMFYAAYLFGNQTLANLTLVKMTTLSLQFGNSDFSPFGYVGYGLVAGTSLGDYETGYRYGRMAIDLCEQFHNLDITCKANFLFAADVHNWSRHIKESDTFYDRAYETGMESGDWVTMGYTIIQSGSDRLTRGKNLDDLYQITQAHLAFLERAKNYDVVDLLDAGVVQPIRHWQGKTKHKHTFDEAAFSEAAYLQKYAELPYYLAWHYYAKIRAAYHFDDRASWPSLIPKLEIVENFVPSHAKVPETFFYVALMHLALCDEAEMAEREHHFTAVAQLQKRFNIWLENCPANIEHKHLLIEAEKARLHDDRLAAMDLYEQAIAAAAEQDYLNNRALANERYAHFWQQQDRPKIAQVYLLEAITLYGRWGAWGKVQHLEETQAALLQNGFYEPASPEKPNPVGTHYTSTTTTDYLDLATIFKATQTISSEINLDDLLAKMMHIIIENAGAEKGVLLLKQEGDLVIQATIDVNDNRARILQSEPLSESNGRELPESLLRFVSRTGETIVLNDAARDGSFTNDPYIMLREPKSILCLPIRHQDTLMGLLYLENNLIPAAFSEQRIEILTILLSQAAISLENARLFAERKAVEKTLKQYTAELERSNLELQNFAYISSHDLQEPLRKIQTFSDRFANSYQDQLDERGLDYLLRMQNAAARMQTLIQDLLAFARVSSQAKPMSTVDLALLVQDVLTTLETKLEETEATINVQHLPLIEADEAQMKQLFQNLISNALKFQQPDVKPEIHITYVTAVQPESKWPTYQISVSDNGIGFDMKHAERIFDVFQRLHTRSDYPGTGVGLSICRKIVERHHGTIAVQSEPNQGTTFTLALPAKQQPIV